jgi:hypothetical protein
VFKKRFLGLNNKPGYPFDNMIPYDCNVVGEGFSQALFVILGTFMEITRTGQFFTDLAELLMPNTRVFTGSPKQL